MKVIQFTSEMESTRKELRRLVQVAEEAVSGKKTKLAVAGIIKAINGTGKMLSDIHTAMDHKPNLPKYDGKERIYRGAATVVTKENKDTVKAGVASSLASIKSELEKYFSKDHLKTHGHIILANNSRVKIKASTKTGRTNAVKGIDEALKVLK